MKDAERQHFLDSYGAVLTSTWSSRRFTEQLRRDPLGALARCGLAVPDGSHAEIVDEPDSAQLLADPDAAVTLWENGHSTGTFVLHVPTTPHPGQTAGWNNGRHHAAADGPDFAMRRPFAQGSAGRGAPGATGALG